MIAVALLACAVAMLLVRLGWGGAARASVAGWALAAVALVALATTAGAWGVSAGATVGMAVAIGLVLHAGWTAPAKVRRPAREPASVTLPRVPADLARRIAVFVLVVPVAFVAAQWCAFGAQAMARRLGSGEADATVLTLFAQPIMWGALMAWQMTRANWARMIGPAAITALSGTLLWGLA